MHAQDVSIEAKYLRIILGGSNGICHRVLESSLRARVHRMSDRSPVGSTRPTDATSSLVFLRNMQIGPNIHVETYVASVTDEILLSTCMISGWQID